MTSTPKTPDPLWRTIKRLMGYLIGAGLLGGSVYIAVSQAQWQPLLDADWRIVGLLIVAVMANLVLTTSIFWPVTCLYIPKDKTLKFPVMFSLIASSSLLNYLPMRAGLIGRAAYLKKYYDVPLRDSIKVLLIILSLSAMTYAVILMDIILGTGPWLTMGILSGVALLIAFIIQPEILKKLKKEYKPLSPTEIKVDDGLAIGNWFLVRIGDVWITACRLVLAFSIMGVYLNFYDAMILATCGMFITLVGITPNGLGLREWVYGLIASSGFFLGDVENGLQLGLAAALIDRAIEVIVITPTGLLGVWHLKSRAGHGAVGWASRPS